MVTKIGDTDAAWYWLMVITDRHYQLSLFVAISNRRVVGGGWWLPVLYYTEPWGWLASNDRLPILSCTNNQVKGEEVASHPIHPHWISPCSYILFSVWCWKVHLPDRYKWCSVADYDSSKALWHVFITWRHIVKGHQSLYATIVPLPLLLQFRMKLSWCKPCFI